MSVFAPHFGGVGCPCCEVYGPPPLHLTPLDLHMLGRVLLADALFGWLP